MSDITVKQVLGERARLQAEIRQLIHDFEKLTQIPVVIVGVEHCDISTTETGPGQVLLSRVTIQLGWPPATEIDGQ